tara:strand:+ start:780 stop:2219 length:1440 start_codon:yes stop_codon:yes gene_type:complete
MKLFDWQIFFLGNLYCWKRNDTGLRRFKNATLFIPRKSGKSALLAAMMISSLVMDGVAYGQAYAVAADRGQASLLRDYMSGFIKRSPELLKIFDVQTWLTRNKLTDTTMRALHADWRRLDGLNPYFCVLDEFHAQEGPELDDVINSAFGSQPEYIYVKISTAGEYGIEKPAIKAIDLGEKVLEGLVDIDDFLFLNYTIDEGDDWADPAVWAKANPSLGHCKSEEYLTALVAVAKEIPQKSLDFRTKQLNCWIESYNQWIYADKWEELKSDFKWEDLQGCRAWIGMDLARVRDLSCLVAVVETDPDEPLKIVAKHFIPNDDIEARTRRDKVPYAIWRNEGHIVTTDGNTTDFDAIFETIMAWGDHLDIQELAYDRHFSAELVQKLDQEGVEMVPFGQGFISMNDAICGIERRLLANTMVHNGDPVLAWCASNTILAEDPAGNRKPDKKRSKEKIDAIVALGMAVARADERAEDDGPQIYL